MAQNLQNHHVSICAKRKFLSISTRKKVMIEKLFNKFVCLYLTIGRKNHSTKDLQHHCQHRIT